MPKMPDLPCLPGFNFETNLGRTRFHRSQLFGQIHDDVYYLLEKPAAEGSRYPAIYAWGERPAGPTWLALDGQRLKFHAYFQESLHDGGEPYRVRLVDISFFLEDGTMKVCEPSVDNSGLEQGVLVRRQRIPLSDPVKYRYFDILDLNIGKEPKIFGRVYKIFDCDNFTRSFLNRMGIPVPDPLEPPKDPLHRRLKSRTGMKNKQKKQDTLGNFLKYDRKVLRFFGYWDDTHSPYGYIHDLELLYYLADDTMDIIEILPVTCGPAEKSPIIKKLKIPKFFTSLNPLGSEDPIVVLNVLGESTRKGYYIPDSGYCERLSKDYYRECDLTIGAQMNVFGRRVVITDLDEFTKEYYRIKYGLDDFTPLERPGRQDHDGKHSRYIPPYNGWGTYEDSLANCFSMVPKRPKVPTDKYFNYESQENDTRILRYGAKMISDIPENKDRCFVICVYPFDNTVAINEVSCKTGITTHLFQKRLPVMMPGQNIFISEKPKYYEPPHFYIGATLELEGFKFHIEAADEYTLNYMENHSNEFPKSDVTAIMSKIRERLKPAYREFIGKYSPFKSDKHKPILMYSCLREALLKYLGDCAITEHEIVTVARHYALCEKKESWPREYVRALVHTELNRMVWNELERLEEDINEWDRKRTGYLDREQLYTILRANRVPLSRELLVLMLERLCRNEEGKIDCKDLLSFLNIKVDPLPPMVPVNLRELYWTEEEKARDCKEIDWSLFLQDLNLENELKELKTDKDNK